VDWENWIALIGVIGGLVGALVVALVSHQHDRQQQGRATLLAPAEHFSRSALKSLALLRYVTPPGTAATRGRRHRNECVLEDAEERRRRLIACRSAIDVVRADRAHVRLAYHPESRVAASSQRVLGQLRDCLEAAENFFDDYDEAAAKGNAEQWRRTDGHSARDGYKKLRKKTYNALEQFHKDVAVRLQKPSWNPRKVIEKSAAAISHSSDTSDSKSSASSA